MINLIGQRLLRWDRAALTAVEPWRRRPVTAILKVLTYSGTGQAWLTFSAILNILDRCGARCVPEQRSFLRALFCPLFAWGAGSVIKKTFKRRRPADCLAGFKPVVQTPSCYSFPSSHASSTTSLFVALLLVHHPLAAAVGIWAGLVTFSRTYLGLHFPSDLLAGVLLGAACGTLIFPINIGFHAMFGVP